MIDALPDWIKELPLKDAAHLAAVHQLPCCVCEAFGLTQQTKTTAHHVIHGRHGHRKTPDGAAIPLCDCHHQGSNFANGYLAIHEGKETWREAYGNDHDYSEPTRAAIVGIDLDA